MCYLAGDAQSFSDLLEIKDNSHHDFLRRLMKMNIRFGTDQKFFYNQSIKNKHISIKHLERERKKKNKPPIDKPVQIVTYDGFEYKSASEAARQYGVARSALIELCLKQKYRRTVGGFRFEYVEGIV
jgi:hypothetical protein